MSANTHMDGREPHEGHWTVDAARAMTDHTDAVEELSKTCREVEA